MCGESSKHGEDVEAFGRNPLSNFVVVPESFRSISSGISPATGITDEFNQLPRKERVYAVLNPERERGSEGDRKETKRRERNDLIEVVKRGLVSSVIFSKTFRRFAPPTLK